MKLYIKHDGKFNLIEDFQYIKIGDLVKIFSVTKNNFITKHLYFVIKKDENTLTLNHGNTIFIYNIEKETLEFKN